MIAGIGLGAITGAMNEAKAQDLKLVKDGLTYNGFELTKPEYIDVDSALLTIDNYIVFRSGTLGYGRELMSVQYMGIECDKKRWLYSQGKPVFETVWRDYTKNENTFDNQWPRNVENALCGKVGIRSIPHSAKQVLFLNYSKKGALNFSPMQYDEAVDLGLIN